MTRITIGLATMMIADRSELKALEAEGKIRPERRNGRRHAVVGAVSAQILLDRQSGQSISFRPFDVSSRGLGIWSDHRLDHGTTVYLRPADSDKSQMIPMTVRWCRENFQNTRYYRIGLEVVPKHIDLMKEWSGLPISPERPEYSETMVMALLGTVARDVAHDINNATHTLMMNSASMRRQLSGVADVPAKVTSLLDSMERNAQWIGRTLRTLRAFAGPGEAEQTEMLQVDQILMDLEVLCSHRFRQSGIALQVEHADGELCVFGQRTGLTRALMNLINNSYDAVKDQPAAWVRVGAGLTGGMVTLSVIDSGPPMTDEVWQRIVKPYETSKGEFYAGLGLDITHRIVTDHQGRVTHDSGHPNCCIRIMLPRPKPAT